MHIKQGLRFFFCVLAWSSIKTVFKYTVLDVHMVMYYNSFLYTLSAKCHEWLDSLFSEKQGST